MIMFWIDHLLVLCEVFEGQNNPHRPEGSLPDDGLFIILIVSY